MKTIFNVLFILITVISWAGIQAQSTLEEGMIEYEITDVSSDDPQVAAQLSMMEGSKTTLYFKEGMQRTDVSMMGGMMQQTFIYNTEDKNMTQYMNMGGQKIKIELSEEELEKQQSSMEIDQPDISYDKSDTKSIAGYDCYKAIGSMEASGQKMNFTFYITEDISVPGSAMTSVNTSNMKGVPLAMTIALDGSQPMEMTYTAQKVSDELPEDIFTFDGSGYKEMTMEEMRKQMHSGMPGM